MHHLLPRATASLGLILLLVLILAACGQASTGNTAGADMNRQEQPTGGPNASVSSDTPQARQLEIADTPSGGVAQGRIIDSAGNPIAGVLVMPESTANPPQAIPEIAVLTDEQGRYQWTLSPGPYKFTFTREGYAPITQTIVIKPDQPAKLDVTLQKQ
jgi:Carboxypeptidase regulatory-like domain